VQPKGSQVGQMGRRRLPQLGHFGEKKNWCVRIPCERWGGKKCPLHQGMQAQKKGLLPQGAKLAGTDVKRASPRAQKSQGTLVEWMAPRHTNCSYVHHLEGRTGVGKKHELIPWLVLQLENTKNELALKGRVGEKKPRFDLIKLPST